MQAVDPGADEAWAGSTRTHSKWSAETVDACRRSAAETMFQLSLSEVGKAALLVHAGCLGVVRHHAMASAQSTVQQQCAGALRCLEGVPRVVSVAHAVGKHLMLSYQWDSQEVVVRIVGSLKQRGFAVWFDMVRSCSLPRRVLDLPPEPSHPVSYSEPRTKRNKRIVRSAVAGSNERQHAGRHGGGGGGRVVRADVHVGQLQSERELPARGKL